MDAIAIQCVVMPYVCMKFNIQQLHCMLGSSNGTGVKFTVLPVPVVSSDGAVLLLVAEAVARSSLMTPAQQQFFMSCRLFCLRS